MKEVSELFYALMPSVEAWLRGVVSDEVQKALEVEQSKKRPPRTLTRKQVSEMLHVSLPTLWQMVKDKRIAPLPKTGRRVLFAESEVKRFLQEGKK